MAEIKKTEGLNLQPQALEAEEAVLGSMMIDEDAANKAVSILGSSHHFYKGVFLVYMPSAAAETTP